MALWLSGINHTQSSYIPHDNDDDDNSDGGDDDDDDDDCLANATLNHQIHENDDHDDDYDIMVATQYQNIKTSQYEVL